METDEKAVFRLGMSSERELSDYTVVVASSLVR